MRRALLILMLLAPCAGTWAQMAPPLPPSRQISPPDSSSHAFSNWGRSLGGQVLLTNSGFGLGAHLRVPMGQQMTVSLEISLAQVKDEREVAYFDRLGRRDIPNKSNYLVALPIQLGLERRLFSQRIEDNFRPFILASIGPTLGWEYPYFDDENHNGLIDSGEDTFDSLSSLSRGSLRTGAGALLGIGAYFGRSNRLNQGVRLAYRGTYYFDGIQLLERGVGGPQHYFGTPVIQVYFARFW